MSAALHLAAGRPLWRHAAAVILLTLAGAVAYLGARGWSHLFPLPLHEAVADPACDLAAGPCTAVFDTRRFVRLAFDPGVPAAMQPSRVLVDSAGIDATVARIEFSGVDMNMGLIGADLLDTGGGSFGGDAVLPVCIRGRMTWRAVVTLEDGAGRYQAAFAFDVRRQ